LVLIAVIYCAIKGSIGVGKLVWTILKIILAIIIVKMILVFFYVFLFGSMASHFFQFHPYW
jgi:hypothetical protein